MCHSRVLADSSREPADYHLRNHLVEGVPWLNDHDKEVMRRMIWATAAYCGVKIRTYCVMSNHIHVLVHVPKRHPVSDAELLRRYRAFHPRLTRQQEKRLEMIEADMAINGPLGKAWRRRQLRQMFNLSRYGALLEQRFSIWYNRTHNRRGTLWMGRFASSIAQDGAALREIALYIDMNAHRAGMVSDPKDYRFCGYAEAVAGMSLAREGLQDVFHADWASTAQLYRAHLLMKMRAFVAAHAEAGEPLRLENQPSEKLSVGVRIHCRIRYFIKGQVIGDEDFVRRWSSRLPGERKRPPRSMEEFGVTAGLHMLGRLKRSDAR